jgi:hypothetical protein
MAKKPELNPHFPTGSRTVTLDLEENQWWHLIYTLRGEIHNYRQLRLDLFNRGKEKYKEHIDLYTAVFVALSLYWKHLRHRLHLCISLEIDKLSTGNASLTP